MAERQAVTIEEVLESEFPKEMERWDKWDYAIFGPESFEDDAEIIVHLINEDGFRKKLTLKVK